VRLMKLLRIATLTFDRPLDLTSAIALEFGEVKVTCTSVTVRGKPSDNRIAIRGRIEDILIDAAQGKAAVRWTATGTHRGAFMGCVPTGRVISRSLSFCKNNVRRGFTPTQRETRPHR